MLFVMSLLFLQTLAQPVVEWRDKRCSGITFDRYVLPETLRRDERNFNYNSFFSNYTKLFQFYKDRDSSSFLRLFNWQYGLFITLVVLLFLTFLLSFLMCCVKCKSSTALRNACFWIFVILFVIFVALFITAIVFLSIAQSRYQKASCASYQGLAALLYGNPKANHEQEFIGFRNFQLLLENYEKEAVNLKDKEPNFSNIINKRLSNTTSTLSQNSTLFWSRYVGRTLVDGANQNYSPNMVTRSEPGVSWAIESEFNGFDQAARDVTESASQARFMTGDLYLRDTREGLRLLKTDFDPVFNRTTRLAEGFIDEERFANKFLIATFWTFFAVGILLIVLFLVAICLFCVHMRKNRERSDGGFCCLKTVLILAAFFAFIFALCVLIYMAGLGIASSYCRFISEVNRGGFEALSVFKRVVDNSTDANGRPEPKISNFLDTCLWKNSSGYLPELFNSTLYVKNSYARLIDLVEGPKVYDIAKSYTGNFTNSRSPAIQSQIHEWVLLEGGTLAENGNFTSASLNNSVKAFARELSQSIPNSNIAVGYNDAVTDFRSVSVNVEVMKSALPQTLATTKDFRGSIKFITQCSNLQVEIDRIERALCFSYVRPLNILYAVAAFAALMLFFLLWAVFAAVFCLESEEREQVIVTKADILTVSEVELVPKY